MRDQRIKDIVLSAAQYAVDHTKDYALAYEGVFMGKYTELIVNECCQALWTDECHTSDLAYSEWVTQCNKMKETFGFLS